MIKDFLLAVGMVALCMGVILILAFILYKWDKFLTKKFKEK